MTVIFEQILIAKRDFTDQSVFFLLCTVLGKKQLVLPRDQVLPLSKQMILRDKAVGSSAVSHT